MNPAIHEASLSERHRGTGRSLRAHVILDAALRIFAEKGFDGTTISEIERGAGLAAGKGGFYRHFPSKEAVFRAVVEREIERVASEQSERSSELMPPSVSARDRLLIGIRSALESLERREALIAMLGRDPDRLGDLREHVRRTMLAGWIDLQRLEIGVETGQNGAAKSQDSEALAIIAISAVTGFQMLRRFFGDPIKGVGADRFAVALASAMGATPEH
ncbi:MAG: helix-turn-helix transcriptional regulator [Deltaproteobacteria bacterium]|nr:helix-turn-helix transcriptional regulator [Deltaproteobacteria bacterium]